MPFTCVTSSSSFPIIWILLWFGLHKFPWTLAFGKSEHCILPLQVRLLPIIRARSRRLPLYGGLNGSKDENKNSHDDNDVGTDADKQNYNSQRRCGLFRRIITGDGTPYEFPIRPLYFQIQWPATYEGTTTIPLDENQFSRWDSFPDGMFYSLPRLVYHVDEAAVVALTQYYRRNIPAKSDILDICSSWVSHYPREFSYTMRRISAMGMNHLELACNDQISRGDFHVVNLNRTPRFPPLHYQGESFDVVTCALSIDYLIYPIQVLQECHRVLRPGGKIIISFSNRCFPFKVIRIWRNNPSLQRRLELINAYFHYAQGYEEPRKAFDITATNVPNMHNQDPIYIVEATKVSELSSTLKEKD